MSCENEPIGEANINYEIVDEELFSYLTLISDDGTPEPELNCIEFNYSFTVFVFDENMEFQKAVAVFDNAELSALLTNLAPNYSISINYPISGTLSNGDLVEVNTNEELLEAIEGCSKDEQQRQCNNTLSECLWNVGEFNGASNDYIDSTFKVGIDGTVEFYHESNVYFGTWITLFIGDDLFLNIDLNDDEEIEMFWDANWEIVSFSETEMQLNYEGTELLITKDCDFECNEEGYQICEDETNPGFAEFIFENYGHCIPVPPTHDIVSALQFNFFETEEDALNNTNALPVDGYTNTANPQTIFVRLDYLTTGENLEITEITLEAIPCN
ncbi:MAG: hypothetical protein R3359_06630 [Marinirhabdus sp.]|nr:hypothetical protein [Marinirhabdus sp.]